MDDYKIIIYIVLGILYYGYKFFAKKSENEERTSFAPKLPRKVVPREVSIPPKSDMEEKDTPRPFYETLETTNYETERDKVLVENVNPYQDYRLSNANEVENTVPRFAEFALAPKTEHPIKKLFKNKQKLRESFVLSQVLNKKTL
ncbi:MAG TPA: hypothetical protein DCR46_03445 [Cytophagales bacterium]|nr:hypothetical protein [Cytophagales bacterium]